MATDKQISDLLFRCQYKYKDLAKRDILATLSYFKELSPVVDKYVYPGGQAKDLLTLNGTIPVKYQNNQYNIPVQLYLSDTHPYTPPLSYVRPTNDMSISVSDTVDANGRVNMACLREWSYPQSDLYVVLNLMTMKFSERPPVFAKRQSTGSSQAAANTQQYPGSNQVRPQYPNMGYNSGYPSYNSPASGQTPYPPTGQTPYPSSGATPYPSSGSYPNTPYPNNPYYPMPSQQPVSYMKSGSGRIKFHFYFNLFELELIYKLKIIT